MGSLEKLRMQWRMLFRRGQERQRLHDEVSFHVEQLAAENLAAGMDPAAARQAALRTFGNPTLVREQTGDGWAWSGLEVAAQNLRIGVRTLARTPGFAAIAILIIAIGISANLALFTVVRSVILRPLPFKDSGRLVRLYEHSADDKFPYNVVAPGVFAEWKKQSHSFSGLAILSSEAEYNLSGAGQLPEKVAAAECSWTLFPTLGANPALGRGFTAEDDQPSAAATVILSWGLWQRRFGGDLSILMHTVNLDSKPYAVIGIMPAWFAYPDQAVQLWTPIYHEESPGDMQMLDSHSFLAVGRLKPGVSEGEARAELSLIVGRLHDEHRDDPFVSKSAEIRPLLEDVVGDVKKPLYVLLAATGCLLFIACLNVASLLVARGAARRKELAIRTALGSSRWRLLGDQLTESFILSAAGGALGLLMAYGAIQWFVSARPDMSRVEAIHMDGIVVGFALGLIFLCTIFSAIASSASDNEQLLPSLQEASRSHSMGQGRVRLRKWLLSLEVGLTVVLLIAAGLLLKSYERLRSADLGCVTGNVLTMQFSLPAASYGQPVQQMNFFRTLLERVRALPGVQSAGLVRLVPGQGYGGDGGFVIAEHPPLPLGQVQYAINRWADPAYFAALGIPFLQGHTFADDQMLDNANQVIISAAFSRQYFGNEDPIGKHLITMMQRSYEIVGVVGDTRYLIQKPPQPMMYFPLYMGMSSRVTLALRSRQDVTSLALPVQRLVQQLDPDLAVANVLTMDQLVGRSALDASFDATLLLGFAVLSLLLAAVGLFGVLSYIVAQRTTEIGIRVALGAQRGEVLKLMMLDGLRPAFIGLALGIAAGVAAGEVIRSMLYGVKPGDPAVFAWVVAVLVVVATGACLVPALRASRLDPMRALRAE